MTKENKIGIIILVCLISIPGIAVYGLIGWGVVLLYVTALLFYCLQ